MLKNTQNEKDLIRMAETNDCAVHALSSAASISYNEAHDVLARHGRRFRRGTKTSTLKDALDTLVIYGKIKSASATVFPLGLRPTVAQLIRKLPRTERFLICAAGHAFAYVDGEIRDNLSRSLMRGRVWVSVAVKLPEPKAQPKADLSQADISAMWERLKRIEGRL